MKNTRVIFSFPYQNFKKAEKKPGYPQNLKQWTNAIKSSMIYVYIKGGWNDRCKSPS